MLEKGLLSGLLLGLLGREVLGLGNLVDLLLVHAGYVDLLRRRDHVLGIDSSQGDAVDFERAGDEEDALVESLEEHDALAPEATGKEDQDGTGLQ